MQAENRLRLNQETDFQQIMRTYGTKVYRLVYLFVKDRELAEDITQEVFIKVYRYLPDFRGESSMQTWVCKIAVNESKRYRKKWSLRHVFNRAVVEATSESSVEAEALARLDRANVTKYVLRLIPAYRQIIALHYYADLSIPEVAFALGQSDGTVRTKLHRARQQLKRLMEEEESE